MRTSSSRIASTQAARAASAATLAFLVAITGCATSNPAPARASLVSDADFARLAAGQAAEVDEARVQLAAANDELGRAKLGAVNGRHEGAFARADQATAKAEQGRAATETKAGQDSNEPDLLRQAREDTNAAQRGKEVADARLEYSKKLDVSLKAEVTAAERKVELMAAKVNLAKLRALEHGEVPAAGKYDREGALASVTRAERAHDDAVAAARQASLASDQLRPAQR